MFFVRIHSLRRGLRFWIVKLTLPEGIFERPMWLFSGPKIFFETLFSACQGLRLSRVKLTPFRPFRTPRKFQTFNLSLLRSKVFSWGYSCIFPGPSLFLKAVKGQGYLFQDPEKNFKTFNLSLLSSKVFSWGSPWFFTGPTIFFETLSSASKGQRLSAVKLIPSRTPTKNF